MPIQMSNEDIINLKSAKAKAEELANDLDKAERAGIDVKEQKASNQTNLAKIIQLLSVYG